MNAYYERPAMLALAGEVTGRRILDASCGSGPLFAALRDRGAMVSGFDASAGMLELARRLLGDGAYLQWPTWAASFLHESPRGRQR
jgi:2-polyprenyl-3-methyl-5-hydroxy-6-metoxy-1,4-benzoquinol methylase